MAFCAQYVCAARKLFFGFGEESALVSEILVAHIELFLFAFERFELFGEPGVVGAVFALEPRYD